jgi:hypothetical protein
MAIAAFISSATTGAAALPGRSPIAFHSVWRRAPCCRGPHPNAFNRALQITDGDQVQRWGITRPSSNLMPPMSFWPMTPDGRASV